MYKKITREKRTAQKPSGMASAQAGAETGAQGCRSEPLQLPVRAACYAAQKRNVYCQGTVKKYCCS